MLSLGNKASYNNSFEEKRILNHCGSMVKTPLQGVFLLSSYNLKENRTHTLQSHLGDPINPRIPELNSAASQH